MEVIKKSKNAMKSSNDRIIELIKKKIKTKTREIKVKIHPEKLSDKEFLNILHFGSLDGMFKFKKPLFFFDPLQKKSIIRTVMKEYPKSVQNTINDANRICDHHFNLLGSNWSFTKEIDWHLDFKTGFRWNPHEYYCGNWKFLDYLKSGIRADILIPWTLSRFYHLPILGKAYWYTGDEKYVLEFKDQIDSWINANHLELGINWALPIEIAIRAVNWIWAYYFFDRSDILSTEFKIKYLKNLFLHGRVIYRNFKLENRNNHYISSLIGLIYLGIFFRWTGEGKKWLDKGLSELKREIKRQVFNDGVDFEGSIFYHHFVTELILSATILCLRNGIQFPKSYLNLLEKTIEFIIYYTRPDGSAPQIGDSFDGGLHYMSNYKNWNTQDHRYLISVASLLFKRQDFTTNKITEEAFWIMGNFTMSKSKKKEIKSKSFDEAGFYIMRDGNHYMIIDCTFKNPKTRTEHRHNSALNFEIFAGDKSFIIDPGTFVYTSNIDMRNLFRSTKNHNVVVVDGQEQNRFVKKEAFGFYLDSKIKINKWDVSEKYDFMDAQHTGYERLKQPVTNRRQIYFDKNKKYWLIRDILLGEGKHNYDLNFHFAPMKLDFFELYDHAVITKSEGTNMVVIPLNSELLSSKIKEGWVSYNYGYKISSKIIKYSKNTKNPAIFFFLIIPFENKKDLEFKLKSWEYPVQFKLFDNIFNIDKF